MDRYRAPASSSVQAVRALDWVSSSARGRRLTSPGDPPLLPQDDE